MPNKRLLSPLRGWDCLFAASQLQASPKAGRSLYGNKEITLKLILGRTKYQKFESIVVLFIIIVALAIYGLFKFIDLSGQDTKAIVSSYISESSGKNIDCNWSGYVEHKKTDLLQVFVNCNTRNQIPSEINSKSDLFNAIDQYVVSPAIQSLPLENNLSVVLITQIDEQTVVCTDVRKHKVTNQWLDSYENYCWPQ
ncbi:MAG: hypothetical protein ACPF9K_07995 [Neptuniibacter sp.]